jgi:DNA-binding XRE family transcriptional regulator
MENHREESISVSLERLALTLGESGAVPVPELVRALERAAERLRTKNVSDELPFDLVTQAEASRAVGVSRQAVNQWVRNGNVRSYAGSGTSSRYGPKVSLAEVAIAANRRSRDVPFSHGRRRELLDFLPSHEQGSTASVAGEVRRALEDDSYDSHPPEQIRVLGEFVVASMGVGDQQHEFTPEGLQLLAELEPSILVDTDSRFGRLAESLRLLVGSSHGKAGFDSPAMALLAMVGCATVGALYSGDDAQVGRDMAAAAHDVWGPDWAERLLDAVFHLGELRPTPLTRFTASLTYLDHNRFLRKAQAAGVSVAYSRGPGPLLPQRFYGAPILHDMMTGTERPKSAWAFSEAAAVDTRPAQLASGVNPFRVINYEYGLLDPHISGIRRYCFSTTDARRDLRDYADALSGRQRHRYVEFAVAGLTRTLLQQNLELAAIDSDPEFDWWKDHIIRSSQQEVLLGLRDERARTVAHALLVSTSLLPEVVEAAHTDGALRDRLRIYVKNLEFDVIDARYRDDVRRGITRVIKTGGLALSESEARTAAEDEIHSMLA